MPVENRVSCRSLVTHVSLDLVLSLSDEPDSSVLINKSRPPSGDNASGDCKEPWYNIHKGAEILVDKMGGNPDGNIISALGQYNGWMVSLHLITWAGEIFLMINRVRSACFSPAWYVPKP